MYVEVDSSPNWEGSVFIRFREQGQARRVTRVRAYDRISTGEWCTITGLSGECPDGLCDAFARPVEDSGAGTVFLVSGGNWGLRLKPASHDGPWSLDDPSQWGEPYLLMADVQDLRFEAE